MPTPYRPSNGMEGAAFQLKWCAKCCRDSGDVDLDLRDGCQILASALLLEIDDPHYPAEWIEDDTGPRCTMWNVPLPTEADRKYLEWKAART